MSRSCNTALFPETGKPSAHGNDHRAEAEQALVALGYKLTEAAKLIAAADAAPETPSEELIRLALRIAGGAKG